MVSKAKVSKAKVSKAKVSKAKVSKAKVSKAKRSVQYEAFEDGERIDRYILSTAKDGKIIEHKAIVRVMYLVEFEDGTRNWLD